MATPARDAIRQGLSVLIALAALGAPAVAQPSGLVVSVAASLHDALVEIAGLYRAATGMTVALNPGGSNTLARQIVEGAPVGLFLSADEIQMDIVDKAGRVAPGTRTVLLTNELAVVVSGDARASTTVQDVLDGRLARLAMGEPSAVPAGVYARRWLEHEKAWDRVAAKVVPFPTVRAVLSAVEAGRVDAGIVYRTDAMTANVRVIARVSSTAVPSLNIVQPAAVIAGPMEKEARRFLEFLKGDQARAVFVKRGFGIHGR
ncbi:MAG TPA: molybdate ABC transporter substrate-binding protein [Vicinamibacterales bacterium]|nr:molybdate ABC transporter substrate-binding protein [Vicinamibacterales bacterium]